MASLHNADWEDYPTHPAEHVFEQMALFDEHTWGATNPWDNGMEANTSGDIQWRIKSAMALDAYYGSRNLLHSGMYRLADAVLTQGIEQNSAGSLLCFNTTSYEQTGLVETWLPKGPAIPEHFSLIDAATGETVPYTPIWRGFNGIDIQIDWKSGGFVEQPHNPADIGPRPRGEAIAFVASQVPAHGFKGYLLKLTSETLPASEGQPEHLDVLENAYYKLRFDVGCGALTSLYDKQTDYEYVNADAAFAFGEIIYDRYTSAPKFNHLSSRITGSAARFLGGRHRPKHGQITRRTDTYLYSELEFLLSLTGCEQVTVTVRLHHMHKRIDWTYRLAKITTPDKEAVYVSFPFVPDLGCPGYELTGGSTSLDTEHVPGSCDYLQGIQNWLALSNGSQTALWSTVQAPLIEQGTIYIPFNPFEQSTGVFEPSTVYSYAFNNIWDTNFPYQQGGETILQYSMTSYAGAFRYERAYQFGEASVNPLHSLWSAQTLGPTSGSLLRLDGAAAGHVQIISVRPAHRMAEAIQVRLQEIAGQPGDVRIELPAMRIKQAWSTNLAGEQRQVLDVVGNTLNVPIVPGALATIIVRVEAP
jgi:hypothetical protein